jgi:hypothetical protein
MPSKDRSSRRAVGSAVAVYIRGGPFCERIGIFALIALCTLIPAPVGVEVAFAQADTDVHAGVRDAPPRALALLYTRPGPRERPPEACGVIPGLPTFSQKWGVRPA